MKGATIDANETEPIFENAARWASSIGGAMSYQDLCAQMAQSGWLSHMIVACQVDHIVGAQTKLFTVPRLQNTRTYKAFSAGEALPVFDPDDAVKAIVRYHERDGSETRTQVLVDRERQYLAREDTPRNQLVFGYLSDRHAAGVRPRARTRNCHG